MKYKKSIGMIVFIIVLICIVVANSSGSDFVVEYYAEQYNEKLLDEGNDLKLYHALQVKTSFGPKLLVLTGTDMEYRNWLREYLSYQNTILIKIPDSENQKFMESKVFYIGVQQIHSVAAEKWQGEKAEKAPSIVPYTGRKNILLVDDDTERLNLTKEVIENLGYPVVARQMGQDALITFSFRPDKFNLLITSYSMPSMNGVQLTQAIMEIKPDLPVILCMNYGQTMTDAMQKECAKLNGNYIIKEVLLRDIGKTIRNVLGGK